MWWGGKMKFLVLCLFFISCNQKFRTSLCQSYLTNIPESYVGTYRVNFQQIGDTDFVARGGNEVFVNLTKLSVLTSSMPSTQVNVGETNFCEIDNRLAIENVDFDGTYTYSMVTNAPEGLYIAPVVLKSKTNLSFVVVPEAKDWEGDRWIGGFSLNILGSSNRIVNNKNVPINQVIPFLDNSSTVIFYERVTNLDHNRNWRVLKKL